MQATCGIPHQDVLTREACAAEGVLHVYICAVRQQALLNHIAFLGLHMLRRCSQSVHGCASGFHAGAAYV